MKKWKSIVAGALIIGLVSVITACSSETSSPAGKDGESGYLQKIKEAGFIQVGSTPTGPPFTFLNPKTNEIEGLMVDVAQKIGDELGVKVQINPMTFASLIPAIEADKINMISAGMQKSEERAKVIDFSIPVYSYGETIVVAKDNDSIKSLDDLKGKNVGVQEGGLYFQKLKEHPEIVSQGYKSTSDMVAELKNGRIDAFLGDYPI
ncbi:MAG: substrate-binding periplasmic protein, partial [Clostridia bacterium]